MSNVLTPMEEFAVSTLRGRKGKMNPSHFAVLWAEYKTGRLPKASSRDSFGYTSAAYRTLRNLTKKGIVTCHSHRTSGGYHVEEFSIR